MRKFLFLFIFLIFVNVANASVVLNNQPTDIQNCPSNFKYISFEEADDPNGYQSFYGVIDDSYNATGLIYPYYWQEQGETNSIWFDNDTYTEVWCDFNTGACPSTWPVGKWPSGTYTANGTWYSAPLGRNAFYIKLFSGTTNISFILSSNGATSGTAYNDDGTVADTFTTTDNYDTGLVSYVRLTGTNITKVYVNGSGSATYGTFLVDDVCYEPKATSINYDPSGYILDAGGNALVNAYVNISNSSYSDYSYSDIYGYWHVNIYEDGVYNYTIKKSGYKTLTGSQNFVMGGSNYNFTLNASSGLITGYTYTYKNSSGGVTINGDLQNLQTEYSSKTIITGSTLTLGEASDGSTYVIKLIDVDSQTQEAVLKIYRDGSIFKDSFIVKKGEVVKKQFYENLFYTAYIKLIVNTVFEGGELDTIKINAGYVYERKTHTALAEFITSLINFPSVIKLVLLNLNNWLFLSSDNSNTNAVTFNASNGQNGVGSIIFDVGSEADIYNFYIVINAESITNSNAVIKIGYTDDDIEAPQYYQELYINEKDIYKTSMEDFKAVDSDADGKIRVWFKFDADHSSFNLYEFYLQGFGSDTIVPLSDVNIYYNSSLYTTSDQNGYYSLNVPLSANDIIFSKIGYETKTLTHEFNNTYPQYYYEVFLNKTDQTVNQSAEYVRVEPNPLTIGTQGYIYYKTLDKTNPLLLNAGGYEIAVCQVTVDDCLYKYSIDANDESSIPLDPLPIGEYSIKLTGFKDGMTDFFRDIITVTNLTVISNDPSVNWDSDIYYLGEKMRLKVYVPSGYETVWVKYPNNSILVENNFSASTKIQNLTFQTDINLSLNQYPVGVYSAGIYGYTDIATAELKNISKDSYLLNVPDSIKYGEILKIKYQSPRTTTLYVTTSNNTVILSTDVDGIGTYNLDTTQLANADDTFTIQLIRDSVIKAETTVSISADLSQIGMSKQVNDIISNNLFWGLIIIFICLGFGASMGGVESLIITGGIGIGFTYLMGLIPSWMIFLFAIIIMLVFAIKSSNSMR